MGKNFDIGYKSNFLGNIILNYIIFFSVDRLYVGTKNALSNVTSTADYYQKKYGIEDGRVFINFTSDSSVTRRGFRIAYFKGYYKNIDFN